MAQYTPLPWLELMQLTCTQSSNLGSMRQTQNDRGYPCFWQQTLANLVITSQRFTGSRVVSQAIFYDPVSPAYLPLAQPRFRNWVAQIALSLSGSIACPLQFQLRRSRIFTG